MKTIYTVALLLFAFIGFAQAPQLINYQGVARSANGKPIASTNLKIFFEILKGSAVAYSETQTNVLSNPVGIFNTQIGKTGNLSVVDWSNGPFDLRVSIDTTNVGTPILVGSQQIVSAPYALYAPTNKISYDPNTAMLTIGNQSQSLAGSGAAPTFTVVGNTAGLVGDPLQQLPIPTFANNGPTTITGTGPNYTVNSPSVTITPGYTIGPGVTIPPGLLQIFGSSPNYSLAVTPNISYNGNTGLLSLSAYYPPAYQGNGIPGTYTYNISPNLSLSGSNLSVGANSVPLDPITPWRTNSSSVPASTQVWLANSSASVGVGVTPAAAKMHVDGYTILGNTNSPGIQVSYSMALTPAPTTAALSYPFPVGVTASKIISYSVLINGATSNLVPDWYPPSYGGTVTGNYKYYVRTTNTAIVIEYDTSASANLFNGKQIQLVITHMQ